MGKAWRTDRQTQNLPCPLPLLPELVMPAGSHFASQGKGGGEAGASVGPGQPDPAWSASLHLGSWLPPSEEGILVQEPEEGTRGGVGEKTWRWTGCWKGCKKKEDSPDQHSRRLSEQGLPCLKSGRPEGPEGRSSQFLPLQLATFSLEALGCLSESLTLLTCGVGGTIPDLKVDERMPMGMGGGRQQMASYNQWSGCQKWGAGSLLRAGSRPLSWSPAGSASGS